MIKDNGDGTWSTGKPDGRISTFKLNEEFEEDWGHVKSKSICSMSGQSLVRKTQIIQLNKEVTVTIDKHENELVLKQKRACIDSCDSLDHF